MKKKAKKALSLIVSALFMFNTGFVYAETDKEEKKEDTYAAKSVVLAEAATGQILYSQNPNEKLAIASVTKIMTLLLAAEEMKAGKLSMEDAITASYNAFITDGSVIWLNEGEKMSVYDITRSIVIS
ncbi:MAG: serine hydrolase, partial [Ruminiclostridium sp.]|nr:serine hydrolase [Ruminiclostridium sp.]